jgi:K+-sensing histidine kinase KdpD
VIRAAHASVSRSARLLPTVGRVVRLVARRRAGPSDEPAEDALLRALCHDMRGPLAALTCALRHLTAQGPGHAEQREELLSLAGAQAAQLASMLRTVEASGEAAVRRPLPTRRLCDVVAASVSAAGLPRRQLTVRIDPAAAEVPVGDARLQRILWNLLENAHRHGDGAPVALDVVRRSGWVEFALSQPGLVPSRVVEHLSAARPPTELAGLGLWSVRRQTRELGGIVLWDDDGSSLTLRIVLPDR